VELFGDNQSAIALTQDNRFHAWTKHIDIKYHFICEQVENGTINLQYIQTEDNVVAVVKVWIEIQWHCWLSQYKQNVSC
jgi:c-di-GMP-binding flagellar brake protein YcgR